MRVAYAGEPGAFGELAASAVAPDVELVPLPSFAEVARAVSRGEVDAGVVPVENALAGPVQEGIAAVLEVRAPVRGERRVRVEHRLLGVPGATLEDVREVTSHPQALAQCRRFLEARSLTARPEVNTAVAARRVAEAGRKELAAIASAAAGERLGLVVLAREIADGTENVTRFLVLGRAGREEKALKRFAVAPVGSPLPASARVLGHFAGEALIELAPDDPIPVGASALGFS